LLDPEDKGTVLLVNIGNYLVNKIGLKHSHVATYKLSRILNTCVGVHNDNFRSKVPFVGRGVSLDISMVLCLTLPVAFVIFIPRHLNNFCV